MFPKIHQIRDYLQGNFRYIFRRFLSKKLKDKIAQRIKQVEENSPLCITQGECLNCGCKTPQMFYADKRCSNWCYDKL
mgnify:CR=1 FL=1